jgi:hypothetical protein
MKLSNKLTGKMKKIILSIMAFLIFITIILGIYFNQLTEWNKNRIQDGKIKQLTVLENIERDKYTIIVSHLPKNESVKNYYYEIIYNIKINNKDEVIMLFNEYENVKKLLQMNSSEISKIEYNIVYYKVLNNSYKIFWKRYFKKCFTLTFNNNEVIEKYLWENKYK